MTEKNWNKLRTLYQTIKENQEIVELKPYQFKNSEIAEYLNIPLIQVNHIIDSINIKCNGISVLNQLTLDRASTDISILKLATQLIKAGDNLQDISIITGLYTQYISDMRKQMKDLGEVTDNFSDSKKAKIRQSRVMNLYVNTIMTQQEIAQKLNITRETVIADIETYLRNNPDMIDFVNTKKTLMSKSSRAEQLILEILKPYGFEHGKTGTLQDYGMGRFELDIFNKELRVAIEYDGFIIKTTDLSTGHVKERDLN